MKTIRIATVKATGERFIVQQLDLRTNKAHVWGELVAFKSDRSRTAFATKHNGSKAFMLDAVDVADVAKDEALMRALFAQSKRAIASGKLPGYR